MPVSPYPEPNATSDVMWLEPHPDLLPERIQDAAPGPDACIEAREASSLAFVATAGRLLEAIFVRDRSYRLIHTRANGQPAFGVYVRDPAIGVFHANGMLVVTLAANRIRAMTRFDNSVIAKFGLPRRLP